MCGTLSVKWVRDGGNITLSINAPEGVYGDIKLPFGYKFENDKRVKALATGEYTVIRMY